MARTGITPQTLTLASAAVTLEAANVDGNSVSGADFLWVKNASGSIVTVTIPTPGTVNGLAIGDRTVSVPATTGERLIPLRSAGTQVAEYTQSTGVVNVDYSAVTSVTVAAVKLP